MKKSILVLLMVGFLFFVDGGRVGAQENDYKNSSDPLVRCLDEARRIASDPDQYSTPDCANKFIEGNVVTFPETAFKKTERGMIETMEIADVRQYFRDWLDKDLVVEYKREGESFSSYNKDLAQQSFHKATREQKDAGIGDFSSLIVRKDYIDIIHIGTGANDIEFTKGKTPVWTFDYGDVNLLVFVGYCRISLSGKVYDDMANEYFDENSEFFKNHHVAISWDDERNRLYKVIDGGSTEGTLDAVLTPTLEFARKTVGRIAGVCGSKNVQTSASVEEEKEAEALVEEVPAESDLAISENAKRLNDELKALFGETELGDLPSRPKVPEITGNTPYLFDNPLSTKDNRYFSFTANAKNHIIEYRGGNNITLEFPDGTTFVPESGDFVRVPVGTKIKTGMGLYQGNSQYDNVGKFGMSSLGITNVAGGSSITLGGGSVVELVPTKSGGSSNVKLNNGDVRIGTGGFGGTDSPDLPTEIQFEGRQDVEISWDGTDFAVSYDRESGKIISEIYDGTIKVAAGEKTYSLSSSYGGEIKQIEIEGNGEVVEKTAIPRAVWRERPKGEPERAVSAEVGPNDKRLWRWVLSVVGVVGLAAAGGFWYRKRFGTWPLEARWRPVVVKMMMVYRWVTSKLKRK